MAKLNMSSPWDVCYKEIQALFAEDPEVHVLYDEGENEVKLYVDDGQKADALTKLLPDHKEFGNVQMKITVIPANSFAGGDTSWEDAFSGNAAVEDVIRVDLPMVDDFTYILFAPKVVQYYTDNLFDYYGFTSTLYQDIAKNLFEGVSGVSFCTAKPHGILMELNEQDCQWP